MRKRQVTVMIDIDTHEKIKYLSEAKGISFSEQINKMVNRYKPDALEKGYLEEGRREGVI